MKEEKPKYRSLVVYTEEKTFFSQEIIKSIAEYMQAACRHLERKDALLIIEINNIENQSVLFSTHIRLDWQN